MRVGDKTEGMDVEWQEAQAEDVLGVKRCAQGPAKDRNSLPRIPIPGSAHTGRTIELQLLVLRGPHYSRHDRSEGRVEALHSSHYPLH
ncbi:hypothetical protein PoMZ_12336 [Pyricularia oryzae]|uniref:Uncharacterized protein n=1 Tax=Pyricularia oryzae TaxID=318829 RepID=A0A4P7NSE7_PYROR|nr:hypothetical protein PoMZ_12336 [Pyricularia oryzae]